MKIAVIGCGGMAHSVHLQSIQRYIRERGGLEIAACADTDLSRARSFAEKSGAGECYASWEELLSRHDHEVDAAVVLVSERAVSPVSSAILRRGIPVLLEKPPGKSPAETDAITDASAKSGAPNMVAFNRRFAPPFVELKSLYTAPRHARYRMYRTARHESNFEDTAIHAVDTARWLCGGDFARVEIRYHELPHLGSQVADYYLYCTFTGGTTADIAVMVSTAEVLEDAEVHDGTGVYRAHMPGYDENDLYIKQGFYGEHEYFYDCIRAGVKPLNPAADAGQSVAVCEGIKNRAAVVEF